MSLNNEVSKLVSAIISLVNNQCSCLVELLGVLTVMLVEKRLVKKKLLLLISSDSKTQNWKKGSRHSPPRNLKWWNDFITPNENRKCARLI